MNRPNDRNDVQQNGDAARAGTPDGFAHPSEELLSSYVDRTLASAERAWVEAHLAGCPACRAEVAELRGLLSLLAGLPEPRPRRSFQLSPEQVVAPRFAWRRLGARLLPASPALRAASAAVVLLLVVFALRSTLLDNGGHQSGTGAPEVANRPVATATVAPSLARVQATVPPTRQPQPTTAPAIAQAKVAETPTPKVLAGSGGAGGAAAAQPTATEPEIGSGNASGTFGGADAAVIGSGQTPPSSSSYAAAEVAAPTQPAPTAGAAPSAASESGPAANSAMAAEAPIAATSETSASEAVTGGGASQTAILLVPAISSIQAASPVASPAASPVGVTDSPTAVATPGGTSRRLDAALVLGAATMALCIAWLLTGRSVRDR